MKAKVRPICLGTAGLIFLSASSAWAEDKQLTSTPPQFSNFGGVGLIETRSARMAPDATLSGTVTFSENLQRYGVTFQPAPWLEASFNYKIFDFPPTTDYVDRQFDLKFRLLKETASAPELAFGLQDFLGTGLFSGEYVVASKRFGPLDLSFGVGWGRLGSTGQFDNPLKLLAEGFGDRERVTGLGGEVNFGQFFQGDAVSFFGGVVYETPIDGLRLIAEYDSDDKSPIFGFDDKIPINVGVSYRFLDGIALTGSLLHGTELNITATAYSNISKPLLDAPKASNLAPFAVREGRGLDPLSQKRVPPVSPRPVTPIEGANPLAITLQARLAEEGIALRSIVLAEKVLQVTMANDRFRSTPKAIGRVARILTALTPLSVEEFRIVVIERGLILAEFDINRETLEISARARGYTANPPPFLDTYHSTDMAVLEGKKVDLDIFPRFSWSLNPDLRLSAFDPDDPLRYNIDLVGEAQVEVTDGLFFSGVVRADLFGSFDESNRESDSVLPRVRSEFNKYYQETNIGIDRLAVDWFSQPDDTLYTKFSAGLLEPNYAGIGGEIFYRPPQSHFSYGANLYYAKQRDFDTRFSFRDYDVVTGQASIYWDTDFYDLDLALHAGRYLAGDYGATLEATRRFANGWEVGAFATFTDVPFDEFGEGSFDKGLIFRIPLDWGLPYETQSETTITLRPLQRDGGQRLQPGASLFRITQPTSAPEVRRQWNEFSE